MPPLNAHDAAHRLIAGEQAATRPPSDAIVATERVIGRLARELTSWFGEGGTRTLLTRALIDVQDAHPALANVRIGGLDRPQAPDVSGMADSVRLHGAAAAAAGAAALLATLLELLARLIGDDIAATLVAQSARAAATGRSTTDPGAAQSAPEDDPARRDPADASSSETRDDSTRHLTDRLIDDGTVRPFGSTRHD